MIVLHKIYSILFFYRQQYADVVLFKKMLQFTFISTKHRISMQHRGTVLPLASDYQTGLQFVSTLNYENANLKFTQMSFGRSHTPRRIVKTHTHTRTMFGGEECAIAWFVVHSGSQRFTACCIDRESAGMAKPNSYIHMSWFCV